MMCPNCSCHLENLETDSRQEWCKETFYCRECEKHFTRRTEYDQNGLVTSDKLGDFDEFFPDTAKAVIASKCGKMRNPFKKKVYQCKYCPNKSNEGQGIKIFNRYVKEVQWICMPCYEEFRSEKARAEGK